MIPPNVQWLHGIALSPEGRHLAVCNPNGTVYVLRLAQPGDTVLIAGKGHETYQEFENTVVPFDDRVYARETLETLGWRTAAEPG